MLGLNLVRSALATLAANITALASTVKDINDGLRQRAALDEPAEVPALQLPIAASTASPSETAAADDSPTAPMPMVGRNGRGRRATAAVE